MSIRVLLKKFQVDPSTSKTKPFWFKEVSSVDVTDYLIDNTLMGDYRVEFTEPFDMGSSRMSFELISSAVNCGLLGLTYEDGYMIGCQVWNNDVADFIGYLDRYSSFYDESNQKYILNFIDVLKLLYDTHKSYLCQDIEYFILGQPTTKLNFLNAYNSFFLESNPYGARAIINIGSSYTGIYNPEYNSFGKTMFVNDFLQELIKHHSGLMYMNGDGRIVFCNRNYGLTDDAQYIDAEIIEDSYSKQFSYYPIYNSILLNVKGEWQYISPGVYQQWEGWALIYYNNGDYSETIGINSDLSNIPAKYQNSYLDLRQQFGNPREYSFTHRVIFGAETRLNVLNSFKQIINPQPTIKCLYKGTNLQLLERVALGDYSYILFGIEKDYTNNTSTLELVRA